MVALSVFRNKFTSQKVLNGWGAAVILGCVISTVLSFLLFVVQLAALYFSPWLAVWAGLTLASGFILYRAARAGLPAPNIKGVASTLSVGLAISLASAVYTDFTCRRPSRRC